MKIIGIDASTTNMGWAIYERNTITASGVFSPKGKLAARFDAMMAEAARLLDLYHPTNLAVEEATGNNGNRQTDRKLSRVIGGICAVACFYDVPWMLIHPSTIKKTQAHKHSLRIAESVGNLPRGALNKPGGEDQADAIGCALAAHTKLQTEMRAELFPY